MEIKTIKPSPHLEKYILFYYELELNNEAYYAYPSDCNVVCLFKNADVTYSNNEIKITEDSSFSNSFTALNKFTTPLFVNTKGVVKEFVIIFKAFGLSQFITKNYNGIPFFQIEEFDDFLKDNPTFFNKTETTKIKLIEDFLLTKLNEKKDLEIILKSISLMKSNELTIHQIAKKCNCSYKKLYRLFLTHCGITPSILRKNIKFRYSLKKMKSKNSFFKLSDVAFDSGFYDQAFFNKIFKKLTSETPKHFFKNVSILSEKEIYFKNIK